MVESGQLPSGSYGLRAAFIPNGSGLGNGIFITGGKPGSLTSILLWDPVTEGWLDVGRGGKLAVGRYLHAAVAIPSSVVDSYCVN